MTDLGTVRSSCAASMASILGRIRDEASPLITAVRFYHYDQALECLRGVVSINNRGAISAFARPVVRHRTSGSMLAQEAFLAIERHRPIYFRVRPDLPEPILCMDSHAELPTVMLQRDPCELNGRGVAALRAWLDIPLIVDGDVPVGKLSCDVPDDSSKDTLAEIAGRVFRVATRWAPVLDGLLLRTVVYPQQSIELQLRRCGSLQNLVSWIRCALPNCIGATSAQLIFYETDACGAAQLSDVSISGDAIVTSALRVSDDDVSSRVIQNETQMFLRAAREKERVVVVIEPGGAIDFEGHSVASEFVFSHGAYGTLAAFPIVAPSGLVAVLAIRRAHNLSGGRVFSEASLAIAEQIARETIPALLDSLRAVDHLSSLQQLHRSLPVSVNPAKHDLADVGAFAEFIDGLGGWFASLCPERSGARKRFTFNMVTAGSDQYRTLASVGTLGSGGFATTAEDIEGTFTGEIVRSQRICAVFNCEEAARQQKWRGTPNVAAAIGIPITFAGRPYGVCILESESADICPWLLDPMLLLIAHRTSVAMASRAVLDCSVVGLGFDVNLCLGGAADCESTGSGSLEIVRHILAASSEITRLEASLCPNELLRCTVGEMLRPLQRIVKRVAFTNKIPTDLQAVVHRSLVVAVVYKVLLAMRGQTGASVVIEADCDDAESTLRLDITLSSRQCTRDLVVGLLTLDLACDVMGDRRFGSGWGAAFRFVQSLVDRYRLQDGRRASVSVSDTCATNTVVMSIAFPTPKMS